jgi:4-hydroxy-2-oxoheptanedioate aldolase
MTLTRVLFLALFCGMLWMTIAQVAQTRQSPGQATAQSGQAAAPRIYNTVKQKLAEGKQVVCATVSSAEPEAYCAIANSGFDCTWIEMQHSTLTYDQAANLISSCRGAKAIPMVRVPDATDGDIQKATDLGALGIIVPMVDTVEKAQAAVKYAKYPPIGRRSQGGGQHSRIWGNDYRRTANDNIMVVVMIENPDGVAIADKLAALPGVDVIFAASSDLGSFSGFPPTGPDRKGNPQYEALITRIHDATLQAKKYLGGPLNWKERHGFTFFQGPGPGAVINAGAPIVLGTAPSQGSRRAGAPIE